MNHSNDPLLDRIRELRLDHQRRTSMSNYGHDIPDLYPPVSGELVEDAERRLGFALPPFLRALYTEVGNGGFGPGYGLWGLTGGHCDESIALDRPDDCPPTTIMTIYDWGCANWSSIDCSTPEGEMVFTADRPPYDIREGITFRQWMQDWADGVDLWTRVCPPDPE